MVVPTPNFSIMTQVTTPSLPFVDVLIQPPTTCARYLKIQPIFSTGENYLIPDSPTESGGLFSVEMRGDKSFQEDWLSECELISQLCTS